MFSNFFKRNKKTTEIPQIEETYSLAEMKQEGKPYILRFRENQEQIAKSGKYPYQMGLATPLLKSDNNGFPLKEENEQLINMEEILMYEFAKNDVAIFVGAITGGGMKEFVFYTGKPQEASAIFKKLKHEIKHHALQYVIQKDPQWTIYKTYGPRENN